MNPPSRPAVEVVIPRLSRIAGEAMKDLLDRINAKYQENTFFYDEPMRPRPGGGAVNRDEPRRRVTWAVPATLPLLARGCVALPGSSERALA